MENHVTPSKTFKPEVKCVLIPFQNCWDTRMSIIWYPELNWSRSIKEGSTSFLLNNYFSIKIIFNKWSPVQSGRSSKNTGRSWRIKVDGQKGSMWTVQKTESERFNEKMDGLKKKNWTAIRDESGRSKRRVTSMLVKNVGDQMWGILRVRVQ